MARIRTIKPEFPHSESMGRVSRDARLLFIELWTICDDYGRCRAVSRMLASLLFPYDDDAPALIDGWLAELQREGCIWFYEVGGSRYLQVARWSSHQKVDRTSGAKCPEPDESSRGLDASSRALASPREPSMNTREGSSQDLDRDRDRDLYRDQEPPHTQPLPTPKDCNPRANGADPVCVGSPSASPGEPNSRGSEAASASGGRIDPIQPPMPPHGRRIARTTDTDLEPWFTAVCDGLRQALTYGPRYTLPTERIVAHAAKLGLGEADMKAIAGHYRAKCKDGTPSFARFADDVDRWRADWQASKTGGQAPRKTPAQLRAAGRCTEHPGESLNDKGRCDLCDEVAALRKRLSEPMEAAG